MRFNSVADLVARLVALLVAVTIHELAHAYMAYRMGDPTAKESGQLTLNPLKHIEPVGFLMFLFIGFGFLGSAPVNPYRMRNPRWGYTIAVASGPFSNLLVAVAAGIPWLLGVVQWPEMFTFQGNMFPVAAFGRDAFSLLMSPQGDQILPTLAQFGGQIIFWNALLFFFNLIPLYPLDGWTVVLGLLPAEQAYIWERYKTQSQWLFFGLIILSFIVPQFNVLGWLIAEPTIELSGLLTGL